MINFLYFQELEIIEIYVLVFTSMASFMIIPNDSPGTLFHLTMNYLSDWVPHIWHN